MTGTETTARDVMATSSHRVSASLGRPNGVLFIVVNVCLLFAATALDLRDLYYKTKSIGPFDSYAFEGTGEHVLTERRLVPTTPVNVTGQMLPRASGWSSFLSLCDTMHGTSFFLSSMGTNCTVGGGRGDPHTRVIPRLVMTGTIRLDAVAWASCQLLFYHRRPVACHSRVIVRFLKRYAIQAPRIPRAALAPPGSAAENELLSLVGVISRSSRQQRAVCVEAFAYYGVGQYHPTIFGCGNADIYEASLAGIHATYLKELLEDKTWLTLDDLNIMGLRFVVRQNDRSVYNVHTDVPGGPVIATHRPSINYSSSGHLYPVLILCDVMIFLTQVASSIQILRELLLPQLQYHLGHTTRSLPYFTGSTWTSVISRSLVRSLPIAMLTVVSQLISWQLIMPNSLIWAWTQTSDGRWQALLSTLRVWELVLVVFVWLWEVITTVIGEHAAYFVTSRTFISLPEIAVVSALVAILRRTDYLGVSDKKYAYDRQRLADFSSFVDAGGYSNAFNSGHDVLLSSTPQYWSVVYSPLLRLVMYSLVGFATVLALKMVYYHPEAKRTASFTTGDRLGSVRHLPYERLPVEVLLDVPIRSLSLLRFRLDMEIVAHPSSHANATPTRYLYAPLYFAFGSIVDAKGNLLRRRGFVDAIPPCIDLSVSISVKDSLAVTGSTLVRGVPERFSRGMSSALELFAAKRASLRFMGHTDPSTRSLHNSSRKNTGGGGDGTGDAAKWLEKRWAARRLSFNVPIH